MEFLRIIWKNIGKKVISGGLEVVSGIFSTNKKNDLWVCLFFQGLPGIPGITGPPGPGGDPGDKVSVLIISWPTWPDMNLESRTHRTPPGDRGDDWNRVQMEQTSPMTQSPSKGPPTSTETIGNRGAMTHLIAWPNLPDSVSVLVAWLTLYTRSLSRVRQTADFQLQ